MGEDTPLDRNQLGGAMQSTKIVPITEDQAVELEALEKAAAGSATQSNTTFLLFGLCVFGALVGPLGFPAAAALSTPLFFVAVKRAVTSGSAAAYMRESGNFAPLLNDRQLLKLTDLVGQDVVLAQLKEALDDGKPLSGSALDYLEACEIDTTPPDIKTALKQRAEKKAADAALAAKTVDVKATTAGTVEDTATSSTLLDVGGIPPADAPVDGGIASMSLIDAIALDPKSLFLSAPVRTGKGALVAGAVRCLQTMVRDKKHPTIESIRIWWLTPKQFRHEDWYWETCDQYHNPNLDAPDLLATVRSIYHFIQEFSELERDHKNPTILGLDEFPRLYTLTAPIRMSQVDPVLFAGDSRGFNTWLVDRAVHSASMLQASGFWVWLVVPQSSVGNLGFSKDAADSFNVVTLATPSNLAFADGSNSAFAAPVMTADHRVFKLGYAAGYKKRDRLWYPIPDFGKVINERTAADPIEVKNRWLSPLPSPPPSSLEALAEEEAEPSLPPDAESFPLADYFPVLRYRPLLIWGPQGSGKSSLAREIVRQKRADGQTVYVLNPHGSTVEWDGCEVVGAGLDYDAIHDRLRAYLGENKNRYEEFRDSGLGENAYQALLVEQKRVVSPVCEEMSSWYHNLIKSVLHDFSLCCLTESRKVMQPPLFVAHDKTLDFVGLRRGARLKKAGLVEIELLAPATHPETGQLISSGQGIMRVPGQEPILVHFPNFDALNDEKKASAQLDATDLQAAFASIVGAAVVEPPPEPLDENGLMIVEYLAIQPECSSCSAVLDKLGTKLERRGLIQKRTVDCLKGWLIENNLSLPGVSTTTSEPETESEPDNNPPPKRKRTTV
jgi:hypothetical protein